MIPGLSKWRIDQARQHATEGWKGQPLTEIPSFRTRIGRKKVDHFIEYISRVEFVQDLAFRTDLTTENAKSLSSCLSFVRDETNYFLRWL